MKQLIVVIVYSFFLLLELPSYIKQDGKKVVLYSILMALSFIETIILISFRNLPSFASIIEKILSPISIKIFGS